MTGSLENSMHREDAGLESLLSSVVPVDGDFAARAWRRLDSLTKPPRSLGRLEEIAVRVASVQESVRPSVDRKAIVLAAGDHGVVSEGVSPYPQDVTWQMVANFIAGGAAINQIAAAAGADVLVYDVGVAADLSGLPGVIHAKVAPGTRNMAEEPAMTLAQCRAALAVGAGAVADLARSGYSLIGTGEMGIGNTTAATALTAAYTGCAVSDVAGPGTGLDPQGVARKVEVVERALAVNAVDRLDPLGVLAAVGGLEIAALTGVVLGAAAHRMCVVTDGFISGAATLAAIRLCPAAAGYVLPSHRSAEPGHAKVLSALGLEPVLDLEMRLGEGTGAALAYSVIDAAVRVMSGMATFEEAGVSSA